MMRQEMTDREMTDREMICSGVTDQRVPDQRIFERIRISSGSGIVVLVLLASVVIAAAQTATGPVDVKIDSVLAADTNQGCDKELSTLRDRLRRLFHFTTYRLVSHDEGSAGFGKSLTFSLPGGRILHIEPRGMDGDMIQMEVMLFRGEEPMMITDLKITNGGTFMVGGPRYEHGTLIISIKPLAPMGPAIGPADTAAAPASAISAAPAISRPPPATAPPPNQ
jgi:hypothetical protein